MGTRREGVGEREIGGERERDRKAERGRERGREEEAERGWKVFSLSFLFSFFVRTFLLSFSFFSFFKLTVLPRFVFLLQASVHTKNIGKSKFFRFSRERKKQSLTCISLSLSFSLSLCLSLSPSLLVSLSIRASAADLPSSSWRHRRAFPVPQEENLELAAALRTRAVMQTTPLRALLPLPRAPLPRPSRSPSPTAASSLATPRLSRACCAPW